MSPLLQKIFKLENHKLVSCTYIVTFREKMKKNALFRRFFVKKKEKFLGFFRTFFVKKKKYIFCTFFNIFREKMKLFCTFFPFFVKKMKLFPDSQTRAKILLTDQKSPTEDNLQRICMPVKGSKVRPPNTFESAFLEQPRQLKLSLGLNFLTSTQTCQLKPKNSKGFQV